MNAKELILAKINAGTNFAKMYIQGMIFGININDLVAFMTCPVVDLIDRLSLPNIFLNVDSSPNKAINLVQGIVSIKNFLHGNITIYDPSIEGGQTSKNKITYVKAMLLDNSKFLEIKEFNGYDSDSTINGLSDTMKAYIKYATEHKDINLRYMFNERDTEINNYLNYCLDLIDKLRVARDLYASIDEFNKDIEEFAKLFNDANEISSIASAWLGLNLGIPTSEVDILKRLSRMTQTVTDRESLFNISDSAMYPSDSAKENAVEKAANTKAETIAKLVLNNPNLDSTEVERTLDMAHEAGLINLFDIIKYLTDEDYALKASDYYSIIKGSVNVFELMNSLPLYKLILNLFKAVIISKNTLSAKSRLIRKLSTNDAVKFDNLDKVVKYVDNLNVFNFALTLPIITLYDKIDGFNVYYENKLVDTIDLSSTEGLLTFKHFIEHEFLDYLKDNYKNNPLVRHLLLIPTGNSSVLATDIDLLNPNATIMSRLAYNDILRGMSDFEGVLFNLDFTIADILLLYNIIVNKNLYGAERLTTAFKVCKSSTNVLNQFLKFIADLDWNYLADLDYDNTDLLIALAPITTGYGELNHSESFIKVKDDVQGYILKRYNARDNNYSPYEVIPTYKTDENLDAYLNRLKNYMENTPFEMPLKFKDLHLIRTIDFDKNNVDEGEIKDQIANLLVKFITNNRALLVKDCI